MPGPLSPQQLQQMQSDGFLAVDGYLYLPTYQTSYQGENNDQTSFTGYQQYDARDIGDLTRMRGDQQLKGRTFGQYDASGNFLGNEVNTWGGTSTMVQLAPYIMAALATMGVGATIAGVSGAAGATGAAGAMGPLTAAETAAANAGLEAALAPYAVGGAPAAGGATFNAAMDSQAANAAIEAAGGDALAGYTSAGVPSVATPGATTAGTAATTAGGTAATTAATAAGTSGLSSLIPGASSLIQTAVPLVGSAIQANAAQNAAETQQEGADKALALYKEMFDITRADQEPWRRAGTQSINRMADLLGISGNTGADGYGDFTRKFDMQRDYLEDPGYQFRLAEGSKALERSAAARGGLLSGRAAKDMTRFAQGTASDEFGRAYDRWRSHTTDVYNRYAGVSGTGQTAATTSGQAATQYGQSAANTTMNAANAQAAAQVGASNAWSQGLGSIYNAYQQNQLMNALLNQ